MGEESQRMVLFIIDLFQKVHDRYYGILLDRNGIRLVSPVVCFPPPQDLLLQSLSFKPLLAEL